MRMNSILHHAGARVEREVNCIPEVSPRDHPLREMARGTVFQSHTLSQRQIIL